MVYSKKQWGYQPHSDGYLANIIYPISFTKFAIPVYSLESVEQQDPDANTEGGATKLTLTGMSLWTWQSSTTEFFWIVIGI